MTAEEAENVVNNILNYLKKQGQTNTFRLASELGIDRIRILNIIKDLENKEAIEFKSGIAKFLKFPREEKITKKLKVKKDHKPKKRVKYKKARAKRKPSVLEAIQAENKALKEKLLELQNAPPKVIRRTKVKKIIQKVPVKSKKVKEQTEHIKELEEKIKELQSAPPKIIRRTIIKKVPVKIKEYITKTIVKKVPVKRKGKKKVKRKPTRKTSKFAWLKNIQKLEIPEYLKKIKRGDNTI